MPVGSDGAWHTWITTLRAQLCDFMPPPTPDRDDDPSDALTDAGRGAVAALMRVVELYDRSAAHRSALRGVVAARLADHVGATASERSVAVAAAALADIDLSVAKHPPDDPPRDPARAVLAASLIERVPGLAQVAETLRCQLECWDGSGTPDGLGGLDIPIGAQIVSVADHVVGNPAPGYLPSWEPATQRAELLAGSTLDPTLVAALRRLRLDEIEVPLVPSETVIELLSESAPVGHGNGSTAADVAAVVTAASRVEDLLRLFAEIALNAIEATEVAFIVLTRTSTEDEPIARVDDGTEPRLSPERFVELAEFTRLAELRAGVPLLRAAEESDLDAYGVGSDIAVPIMLNGEAWGVVTAARRIGLADLDLHDLSVLRHLATQTAVALSNTMRWEQMERMALRDQLTGLANRHVLNAVLDEIYERDPVDRQDCAVIMCDVDGLKLVNDNEGHEAGDRLLIDAAAALQGATRDPANTTICRIGGDEFCMVIDGGALLTAHEIASTIERLFERSADDDSPRSISCGVAFADADTPTRSDLLRAADMNQYETKRSRKIERGEPIPARRGGDRRALRD